MSSNHPPQSPLIQTATAKPVPAAEPDAAKKNKRQVIIALEDYFDERSGRYRPGRSDQSVAEELDLALGFVKQVREEFYGKITEPEEITDMRAELNQIHGDLAMLSEKLEALVLKNNWDRA